MKPPALIRLFRRTIARHGMIRPGDRVLAAVSGGPDSTALLDLLAGESGRGEFSVAVAHLDHGLRGEASAADRRFVEEMAGRLGLDCFSAGGDVAGLARREGRSLEEAGRVARLRFLEETARRCGAGRIATGHHRGDQAEGVLMRILQGSGSAGLAAIRPVHALPGPGGFLLIRPLLEASREEILEYLRHRSLSWRTDASNEETAFFRNRVRRRLMPLLRAEFNPRIEEALARSAGILREEDACLSEIVSAWLEENAGGTGASGGEMSLPREAFGRLPLPLRRRVLRDSLVRLGAAPRRLRFDQIEAAVELAGRGRTGRRIEMAGGYEAAIEREGLVLSGPGSGRRRPAPSGTVPDEPAAARLDPSGVTPLPGWVAGPARGGRLSGSVREAGALDEPLAAGSGPLAHLDLDATGPELRLRARRPGDRFHPLGAPGGRKLGDFLTDAGLPARGRDALPLLVRPAEGGAGPGRPDEIVWVVGVRISHTFRVTERTRRILRLELVTEGTE